MDAHPSSQADAIDNLPREIRVEQLRDLVDTLHFADEISSKGYLITSSELADLMDINASAVTSRGDNWGLAQLGCLACATGRESNSVAVRTSRLRRRKA